MTRKAASTGGAPASSPNDPTCSEHEESILTRARLSGLLRAATHTSIISTDLDGVIQVFNSGSEQMLGYAAEELLGKATPEVFHLREEVEAYARELTARLGRPVEGFEAFVALAREGGPKGYDARQWTYVRKDGGHVPVDLTVTGIYSDSGGLEGYLGVGLDLSARKALEADLRQAQISVDNAGDMIFWVNLDDNRLAYVNETACCSLGYTREELLGEGVQRVNPWRAKDDWDAAVGRLRALGGFTYEADYCRKDGSPLPVETKATLIVHEGVEYAVGIARDITARKALEADLRQAQVSVDSAGDMISWVNLADGRIAYVNQTACRTLGYAREELLGAEIQQINPWRSKADREAAFKGLRALGGLTFEATYRRKDGSTLAVETMATLVAHEGAEYAVGIARDISARKAMEADLRQAQVGMDNVQDMILWVGAGDRRITYVNRAACEALGYARAELLGQTIETVSRQRTLERWQEICEELRRQGRGVYEVTYHRRDGSTLLVEARSTLVVHDGVEYVVAIVRDITARRADEERIILETRLNRSLAEAARALIGSAPDMNAIAGLLLERACELTGSRHGYVAFIDQDTGGMQPRAMSAMMKSGECTLGALPVTFPLGPDGRYRGLWGHSLNTRQGFFENNPEGHPSSRGLPEGHVAIHQLLTMPAVSKDHLVGQIALANPGRDYNQADLDIVASLADVFALGAEQILAQRAIMAAKEEAETSSRVKSDFLANMSHEVRTPLNGIMGMLQVLQSTGLSEEQLEYVAVAQESAERLNLLLNNVIDYARLDSVQPATQCLEFPPSDLLHALQALYEPKARQQGLAFTVEAGPGLPELVQADVQALRQALVQLMDNAFKFTAAGAVRLSTFLAPAAPQGPERLVFRVEDTGAGIPKDKSEVVFQAFVQADASATRTFGGAGLGLAIVRKLATRMGGTVEAQDRPGGGTVMLLTVPVRCRGARAGQEPPLA